MDWLFDYKNFIAVIDILTVAVLLYYVMLMFRGTKAERMFWGLAVVVLVYFLSQRAKLVTLHWILNNFLGSIVIFIIVVFQQDIRRALVRMGRPFSYRDFTGSREVLEEISRAVISMSRSRTGALVAVERGIDVTDLVDAGVELDARVSRALLLSVFNVSSPMHDGAAVIKEGRLVKAGCVLPLSEKELPESMGTRHRAALGLAEESDAVIIVVSEQTGEITLVAGDRYEKGVAPEEVLSRLRGLFSGEAEWAPRARKVGA